MALVAVCMAAMGLCTAFYLREAGQIERNLRDREFLRTDFFARLFGWDLQPVAANLRLLADGEGLRFFFATGRPDDLERTVRRMEFFSHEQPAYDKIRYIDERGQEIIRVNRNGVIAPPDQLQNKADTYFFQRAQTLGPGQIFISPFDLNKENGRVEQPLKPTMRFTAPVFDAAGRRRGACVINYLGADLLALFSQFAPQYQQRLRIINAQGYWLKAARPEEEWGFMFPERAGMTLVHTDPALWNRLLHETTGQVRHAGGLFTWHRIVPAEVLAGGSNGVVAADDFLIIGSEITAEEWAATFRSLRQSFLIGSTLVLVLIVASSRFFFSRRRAMQDLDRFFALTRDMLCIAGFDGYFKRLNPAWEKTLGYTTDELLARPFMEFIHPDDRERTLAESAGLERGKETVSFQNRYRCKDGSYRWFLWNARALVREKQIFASARDVTQRKRSEDEIRNLNVDLQRHTAQLESANHELEAFSYSVSHDLRAPLRHIDGFIGLLDKHAAASLDDKGRRFLTVISDAARQMGRLIDDLLAFSHAGRTAMHLAEVDSDVLVATVIREGGFEKSGRVIDWRIAPLPRVQADPALLRQVWFNLIDNAVKYSGKTAQPRVEIGSRTDAAAGVHEFFVRDNGVGFDMQYAAKLFGVFQRLHSANEFEGTGIGLANVRRIIVRHGGRTWAESRIGEGAVFYFSLPIAAPASPAAPSLTSTTTS